MGTLKSFKDKQVELLTESLDERRWWTAVETIVEFLKNDGVKVVDLKYGFVMDRDTDGLPQGVDRTIGLQELISVIRSGLQEGIIERIGMSDFVIDASENDLMCMLCNDGDIHISSGNRSHVMLLGQKLKSAGITVFDEGKPI